MTKEVIKEKAKRWRDKEVRLVDAVLVGTFVMIGVTGLILSQTNVTITFSSHEIHAV